MPNEIEAWRPDWLCASAYAWLDSAHGNQLAWEFLRRNRQYAKDLQTLQLAKDESLAGMFNGDQQHARTNIDGLETALCLKYGIACMQSPDCPSAPIFSLRPPCYGLGWESDGIFSDSVELSSHDEVLAKFTLGPTLDNQIKELERFLKSLTPSPAYRNRSTQYRLCLRALDGDAVGAGRYTIGKELIPESDSSEYASWAKSLIEQGQALSERKYLRLAFG